MFSAKEVIDVLELVDHLFPLVWGLPDGDSVFVTGIYNSVKENDTLFASHYRATENSAQSALEDYISDYEVVRADLESQYAGAGK